MFIWITLEEFWIEGRGDGIGTGVARDHFICW